MYRPQMASMTGSATLGGLNVSVELKQVEGRSLLPVSGIDFDYLHAEAQLSDSGCSQSCLLSAHEAQTTLVNVTVFTDSTVVASNWRNRSLVASTLRLPPFPLLQRTDSAAIHTEAACHAAGGLWWRNTTQCKLYHLATAVCAQVRARGSAQQAAWVLHRRTTGLHSFGCVASGGKWTATPFYEQLRVDSSPSNFTPTPEHPFQHPLNVSGLAVVLHSWRDPSIVQQLPSPGLGEHLTHDELLTLGGIILLVAVAFAVRPALTLAWLRRKHLEERSLPAPFSSPVPGQTPSQHVRGTGEEPPRGTLGAPVHFPARHVFTSPLDSGIELPGFTLDEWRDGAEPEPAQLHSARRGTGQGKDLEGVRVSLSELKED